MSRIPLPARLTLAFAAAMAVVLAAMALFVYLRVGAALLGSVDQSLTAIGVEAKDQLRRSPSGGPLIDTDTGSRLTLAQLVDAQGRVVRSTPSDLPRLLDARALAPTRAGERVRRTAELPGRDGEWRVEAVPAGQGRTLVLATSLSAREETLHRLLIELFIAGPIALLIASLAGYALARAALGPVETMRRRAAAISASTPGRRLPVPAARDEIARLAETLNDMLSRLEAALEHERRFVADASHELRTPLALLRTEIEVALRRTRSAKELEAALRSAGEETERLTRLAEDLLLVARADQGGLPVRPARVPVVPLLEGVAGRFAVRARERGRALVVVADDQLAIRADRERLEQALVNMVENAIAHGGGVVELQALRRGPRVELHVLDQGPGFPPDFLPRAFDRFSRADEARGPGGTGLGLTIVDAIARAHGGRAIAGERPGGGADVWITVEADQTETTSDEPAVDTRAPAGARL